MSYGIVNRFQPDVVKVNVHKKQIENIKSGELGIQWWITDLRSESRIGGGRKDATGKVKMIVRDAHSDKWRNVSEYPGLDEYASIYGFMENPNELIIGDYDGKDTEGLFIYDLAQKRKTRKLLQNDKYDVSGIVLSPDGTKVVGASYIEDVTRTVFFDLDYKRKVDRIKAKLPGYNIRYFDQTRDGNLVVFKASTASIPNSLMYYDAKRDKIFLISSDYPEIGNTVQGDVTKVSYKARDGFSIPAYLTTPPKIADGMPFKNLPFIIMPHGGPYARDTQSFDYLAQFMASRGYAVLMGAIKNPDLYTCTVSMTGVTDLKDMINDMKQYQFGKQRAKNFILRGFKDRDAIKDNSPVKRAGELRVPLMLAHGEKDTVVYFDQYRRMKSALKKSKAKVTYVPLDDEDHYLSNSVNRLKFFTEMDKFLADNLGASAAAP